MCRHVSWFTGCSVQPLHSSVRCPGPLSLWPLQSRSGRPPTHQSPVEAVSGLLGFINFDINTEHNVRKIRLPLSAKIVKPTVSKNLCRQVFFQVGTTCLNYQSCQYNTVSSNIAMHTHCSIDINIKFKIEELYNISHIIRLIMRTRRRLVLALGRNNN